MVAENVKKIAVLRANGLGDFIFILPALFALRQKFKNAEISLLAKPWHKQFLKGRGIVDRVIILPISRGVRENGQREDPQELKLFFAKMQKEEFDIGLQLHGGGRYSNPFMKNIGAKKTVGLKAPDAVDLDETIPYIYYQNEISRYLEVVGLLEVGPVFPKPKITLLPQDLAESLAVYENKRPFIILHTGASDLRRRWPAQDFAAIGDYFAKQGFAVVLTGSTSENELVQKVVTLMNEDAVSLCGKLSINGLTGLLSRAALTISNDTGVLHLGYALGSATVGLYWGGNMINAGLPTRQNHRPLISWVLQCSLCQSSCIDENFDTLDCAHQVTFLQAISRRHVLDAGKDLLGI